MDLVGLLDRLEQRPLTSFDDGRISLRSAPGVLELVASDHRLQRAITCAYNVNVPQHLPFDEAAAQIATRSPSGGQEVGGERGSSSDPAEIGMISPTEIVGKHGSSSDPADMMAQHRRSQQRVTPQALG